MKITYTRDIDLADLTPGQLRCVELLCRGYSYSQAAARLNISYAGVKHHLNLARAKFGASTTEQLCYEVGRLIERQAQDGEATA